MTIKNKIKNNYPELIPIFKEAVNVALDKAYFPKNIIENYSVTINKETSKIYISKK
jgi:hypothetical protein